MKALSFKPKSVPSSGAMDQPASKALISLRRNNTNKGKSYDWSKKYNQFT